MKREALRKEGLTDAQITVERDRVVEDENGFISYRYEHGFPYITHALVYPEAEGVELAQVGCSVQEGSHGAGA